LNSANLLRTSFKIDIKVQGGLLLGYRTNSRQKNPTTCVVGFNTLSRER